MDEQLKSRFRKDIEDFGKPNIGFMVGRNGKISYNEREMRIAEEVIAEIFGGQEEAAYAG
jgi:hypothetical protein